ncbi:hypothetical protein FA292_29285 [Pseudomonas aeruginosa]|nr:hypothetical protein [Pseudomonas aeruginosa]
MLKVSDFRTIEQLHEFLKSANNYLFESELEKQISLTSESSIIDTSTLSRLVVANDPEALAVAMLYRDALDKATSAFINRRDSITGITPRFWMDFIDAVMAPLPIAMSDLSNLVKRARLKKVVMSTVVVLPEVG